MGGADHVVDYTKPNWQQEVLKITGGKGVDVVYDPGVFSFYVPLGFRWGN
jgi:NADPH:quinone reductase-like Zn-dependent oxidoreductase